MDENMKTEQSKIESLKIVIIKLVFVIVILIGYIGLEEIFFIDKCDATNVENKDNLINKDDEIPSIGSKKLEEIMEDQRRLYITDEEWYKKESFNVSEISDYGLVITAINNLDDKYIVYCVSEDDTLAEKLSIEEFNKSLNGLVLDKKLTIDNIINSEGEYGFGFWNVLINSDNTMNIIGACDGPLGQLDYVEEKIIDVKSDGDKLFVYAKQAFVHYNNEGMIEFYKDYNLKNIIVNATSDDYNNVYDENGQNKLINWDLCNTYKYTFKIVDGKYYFEQFNIEK